MICCFLTKECGHFAMTTWGLEDFFDDHEILMVQSCTYTMDIRGAIHNHYQPQYVLDIF